jgi:hypothetical protein
MSIPTQEKIQIKNYQNRIASIRRRFKSFISKGGIPVIELNNLDDDFEQVKFICLELNEV